MIIIYYITEQMIDSRRFSVISLETRSPYVPYVRPMTSRFIWMDVAGNLPRDFLVLTRFRLLGSRRYATDGGPELWVTYFDSVAALGSWLVLGHYLCGWFRRQTWLVCGTTTVSAEEQRLRSSFGWVGLFPSRRIVGSRSHFQFLWNDCSSNDVILIWQVWLFIFFKAYLILTMSRMVVSSGNSSLFFTWKLYY